MRGSRSIFQPVNPPMPLEFVECFGENPESPRLASSLRARLCPFVGGECSKRFNSGVTSGACTLASASGGAPTVCCPKRLYADSYRVLRDVAESAFGTSATFVLQGEEPPKGTEFVLPFGQNQGHEIRVPAREGSGGSKFSVDWVIARISSSIELIDFVAVEVQTIDTTGNYPLQFWRLAERHAPDLVAEAPRPAPSASSFNYENVNKRILPQLITKGHILRREQRWRGKRGRSHPCQEIALPSPVQRQNRTLAQAAQKRLHPLGNPAQPRSGPPPHRQLHQALQHHAPPLGNRIHHPAGQTSRQRQGHLCRPRQQTRPGQAPTQNQTAKQPAHSVTPVLAFLQLTLN